MRLWITFFLAAAIGCLTFSGATAQPIQLDPDEIVLVSYEKIYFYLSFRNGKKNTSRTDSTVVFYKSRNGYSVDLNTCHFRLRPFKERTLDHRGKSYPGIEFKLADPITRDATDPNYCRIMSQGGIFLGLNDGAIFFAYDNLFNYAQGYVQKESIQLYDILWPMRASEAYSPAGRVKWRSQNSVVSLPEWLKPAIVLGLAVVILKLVCGDRDLKTCAEPLGR